ncbi:pyridoxamine 5'-phosphate oxidase family protein [Streptomyces barringtoniae]|uniref:pyridoxamine 5'-phosphate oxidase family protein n=1 Tax=Streptomyces barringtoniae TaxID=2892029 RepID=UPI001E37CB4D|nr:pyridoxamine 5'-phosphate oxidase family protein [Streptomyces barringtoniae]MCC5474642.1 pyridoxamine 5'-phosphate oxidase family protein [Streptomyces barringtoniae]
MRASPTPVRMHELSGAEALWLLEGGSLGRLVYVLRDQAVIRPARHVFQYGRLVVRTPAPTAAVPATAMYHVDEIQEAPGTGWAVTVAGPAEVITDRDEIAHYQRTMAGWAHGPHDTVLRIHPKTVTGFRLTRAEV